MSSNSDGGPGQREIAYRLFAAEYDDATLDHSESDEERAPNYVVTPTGARVNRLFAVGVLTEVESVNEDVLRARFADPTGAFVGYAGQYQPDAVAFLENTETPEFVALAGKARTFQPEDSDRIYTSVRPESVNAVDANTRDRWVVSAAEATLRRVATFADALAMDERGDALRDALTARGVDPSLASGISLAVDHYGTTTAYLEAVRRLAVDALEVVAGDREQVRSLDLAPDAGGETELGPLPAGASGVAARTASPGAETTADAGTTEAASGSSEAESTAPGAEATSDSGATEATEPATGSDPESAAGASDATDASDAADTAAEGGEADSGTAETAAPTQMEEMAETDPADADAGTEADEADAEDAESAAETPAAGAAAESDAPNGSATAESDAPNGSATAEATESTDSATTETASDAGGLGDFEDVDGGGEDTTAAADPDETPAADAGESDEASPTGIDETEMYEFDEDERQEIEEEFGTDFSTGTEVEAPGKADIETPAADAEGGENAAGATDAADTAAEGGEADSGTAETAAPTQMEEMAETDPADADAGTEADEADAEDAENAAETPAAGTAAESESEPADATSGSAVDESADATATDEADTEAAADVDLETAVVDAMNDIDEGDGADREAVVAAVVDEYGVAPDDAEDAIDDALMNGQCYEPAEGQLKAI